MHPGSALLAPDSRVTERGSASSVERDVCVCVGLDEEEGDERGKRSRYPRGRKAEEEHDPHSGPREKVFVELLSLSCHEESVAAAAAAAASRLQARQAATELIKRSCKHPSAPPSITPALPQSSHTSELH
ncbi:hypothetical protein EYF80_023052 [Liparis tanakae]|uniref:Uncharacterized protein n=1 Tax=Liparis tanakae TaxID=230148 RepID=A0A4Z2HNU7_9TELE|nr:hypothetical protein EYF80_023052 [Liparis tanakae]